MDPIGDIKLLFIAGFGPNIRNVLSASSCGWTADHREDLMFDDPRRRQEWCPAIGRI
jgi:hypothetical protein